jgi:hypothetical protein
VETKYDDIRGGGVPMRLLGLQGKGVEKRWDGVGFFFFFFFFYPIHIFRYEVGDGCKIRFWHDLWCGNHPLRQLSVIF